MCLIFLPTRLTKTMKNKNSQKHEQKESKNEKLIKIRIEENKENKVSEFLDYSVQYKVKYQYNTNSSDAKCVQYLELLYSRVPHTSTMHNHAQCHSFSYSLAFFFQLLAYYLYNHYTHSSPFYFSLVPSQHVGGPGIESCWGVF